MTAPVLGIVGWKNSGKTTLVEKLVAELVSRGYRISTIKHAHHAFDIDVPGADSHRHREAGAQETAIVSGRRWALMHELRDEQEPELADILAKLAPADLVIVEGYKSAAHPKIETRSAASKDQMPLVDTVPAIIAIATDAVPDQSPIPAFSRDNVGAIADFAIRQFGLHQP